MRSWALQDAKAKFSELVETARREGPQFVTRRGVNTVVVVPVEEWERAQTAARPNLKELLLSHSTSRFDLVVPERGKKRRRPIPQFDD